MMCISITDIKALVAFFRNHIAADNKGVRNLVDKIDYYNEEEKILEKEPDHAEAYAPLPSA